MQKKQWWDKIYINKKIKGVVKMFEELIKEFELASERNDGKEMLTIMDKMNEVDFKKACDYFEKYDDLGW